MLQPITRDDCRVAQSVDPDDYHDSRFDDYEVAIWMAANVAPDAAIVIKMGPYRLPIFRGVVTIQIRSALNPTVCRDAGELPWPIDDGTYDLFVSLRSFEYLGAVKREEHLAGRDGEVPPEVFSGVRRIVHAAVISLPWQWGTPGDARHHRIGWLTLDDWFGARLRLVESCGRRVLLGFPQM